MTRKALTSGPSGWRESALCAQADPEAFYPEKGGSVKSAKQICGRCPVRGECLRYALLRGERFGIWGGLTERERRALLRRLPATRTLSADEWDDAVSGAVDQLMQAGGPQETGRGEIRAAA